MRRTQTSSQNSQSVVDDSANEAGMSTAALYRCTALFCCMDQVIVVYSQRCCSSAPAIANKLPKECDASCPLLAK